jgi:PAS domain S-box-containing protein
MTEGTNPTSELRRAESVQRALYRIAELASAARDLQDFYRAVHGVVGELMDAKNFFIALYDEPRQLISWPYYVDEVDLDAPDPNKWDALGEAYARGATAYILRTGEPQLIPEERMKELIEQGEVELVGATSEDASLLGVPLTSEGHILGALVVQSYTSAAEYTEADKDVLAYVGQHVGAALARAQAIEETRQRNAELAVINSVQEAALAGELDLQAVYDLVGDKLQEIFDAQVVDIGLYDAASGLIHFPYAIERGVRFPDDPIELIGFRKHVMETREPLLLEESSDEVAERYGNPLVLTGEPTKSALFVPLVVSGRATGVISLQNLDRTHAFTDADQRLLMTIARSLSVALENARLVHETRQRNAELALISSLQEAIAGELELQAIYDLVGDRLRETFDAQVVDIGIFDLESGLAHYPYSIERGVRFPDVAMPTTRSPISRELVETRAPILIDDVPAWEQERGVSAPVDQGEPALSIVAVPLVSGDVVHGRISLQNLDRTNAFSEDDVRLLSTLAGSLSVALENARLSHETRQRNAELAFINSVQSAIAGELDPQAIYNLVGDKIREIFDAQVVTISTLDETTGLLHYPYMIERGARMGAEPRPLGGFARHVLEVRAPLLITENVAEAAERHGSIILAGEAPQSVLFVPLFTGARPTGVVSLQNLDRENAFTESDERLLLTLAGSLGAALENARLVEETRQRLAELGTVNSVGQALSSQLDLDALIEIVGDKLQEVFDADIAYVALHDEVAGHIDFAYYYEAGDRSRQEPMRYGEGITSQILDSRAPLLLNRAQQYDDLANAPVGTPSLSYLGVPIMVGEKAIGVVSVQSIAEEGRFDESDARLLSTIAANVGVAIQNARLYVETRRRANETAALAELGREISAMLEPDAVLRRIGERALDLLEAETSAVFLADLDGETLRATVALGQDANEVLADTITVGEGIIGDLAARGAAEAVVDTNSDPRAVSIPGVAQRDENERLLAAPLLVRERVIGMMAVWRTGSTFTADDLSFLVGLSQQAAIAIENARLFAEQREAEQKYRELVEQLPLTVYRDLPDSTATSEYISPRVETMFGYPAEAWSDPDFFASILHPDDRERILTNEEWIEHNLDRWTVDYRLIAADGRTVWVRDDAWIVKDEEGEPFRIHGFMIDITEQALAEQEIRRQKQYFESLVDISPVAIVVMDPDERVTGWNPAAADLFGWSTDEALGKMIDDLVFGEAAREEGREVTREALETGRALRIGRRLRRDGAAVDVELMLVPLTVDGGHVGFYAIYHDITELQRARDEAEAATQAKSAFLATMSHEIRTPMNAVIGMTDLLLGTELSDEQREFAHVVHSSGDALLHVIDDILDYSKIEAGKLELEREPFDLRECVEGALDIVVPRAWEKEIELGCLIDEDAPTGIVGDAARLRQVLLNLLSNAVKFTDKGDVVVVVDAEPAQPGSYHLELAVRDTGIGIPQDRMDRLFTSFSQVDASTTRRYGGTGLGLAISKRLVELMGGTISVESEEGAGSTFRIALTVNAADVPTRISRDDAIPHLAGKRVLVVDDNATNREIVSRHARSWEMEPVAVERPSDALDLIANGEPFDVGVLDLMMPDMDGVTLAREIRQHRTERELPLVLLTSLGRLPEGRSSGVFVLELAKPVKASQLYNALVQVLAAELHVDTPVEVAVDDTAETSALRILLAEDNAMNQKVALRLLERLGYGADVVWNGREALEALEQRTYDVVLMDVQMPELDGLGASRQINERWPRDARPRIVAMTANALPEDREACFAAGMDDYVAKPIRSEELAEALRRVRPLETKDAASPNGGGGGGGGGGGVAVDAAALDTLRGLGGDEFLTEVIDTFVADAPELLATLRRTLDTPDAEELRRAAHTLKSNGATLGADEFTELCRELEDRAKRSELEGATELVDRIERAYALLEETLASLRGAPAS